LRGFAASFRVGAVDAAMLMPTIAFYGLGFGILAEGVRLSLVESGLFSAWLYAGAAQMASLKGWADPVPLLFASLTTAAVNARFVLMGATLRPFFAGQPVPAVYASLFFLVDASWALALREREPKVHPIGFFLGLGATMWTVWFLSTLLGHAFGGILGDARTFGVDFLLGAFFAVAAVGFWKRAKDVSPLVVAVVAAIIIEKTVPGPWYILLGALAGSLAGAMRRGRAA
jgi:predicted branched-subunit amino acid permease